MASLKDRQAKRLQDFRQSNKTGRKPGHKKTPEQKAKMEAGKAVFKADPARQHGLKICRESNTRKIARERKKANDVKLLDRPNEYNSYDEYVRIYHNDEVCQKDFESSLLTSDGLPNCPRCKGVIRPGKTGKKTGVAKLKTRPGYYCNNCERQFSITTGTPLFKMKLSRQKFYKLKYYECDDRNGVTYQKMAQNLNIPIYTAFLALKKFRALGMNQAIFRINSGSDVVVDTFSYSGLNSNRPDHLKKTTQECHDSQKHGVAIKCKNGNARAIATNSRKDKEVQPVIEKIVGKDSIIRSDEGGEFLGLAKVTYTDNNGNEKAKYDRITYNHSAGDHGDGSAESLIRDLKQFIFNHGNNVTQGNLQYSLNARVFHVNTKHLTTCQRVKLSSMNLVRQGQPVLFENNPVRRRSTFAKIARIKYAHLLEKTA